MMQRFWSRLAVEAGRRAGLVALVGLVITLVLGFGVTKLKFATGTESYLNADEEVYEDSVRHQTLFGGEASLSVITMHDGHTVAELATNPDNRAAIEAASAAIRQVEGVRGVVDPLVALQLSANLISADPDAPTVENLLGSVAARSLVAAIEDAPDEDKRAREDDNALTTQKVLAIPEEERVIGAEAWTDFLLHDNQGNIRRSQLPIFPDDRHALILTRFDGNLDVDTATAATNEAYEIVEDLRPQLVGAEIRTTGAPKLLVEINDYLRGGMLQLGGIALAIMALIMVLLFDVRWRLLPLGVIVVGVAWAMGMAGWLGVPLTLVTVAGVPVMLGIGIDYAIQMHSRVEEEAVVGRTDHPIQEAARKLGPALLIVTLDAVFAFAALRWAEVPMLRDFGLLLAVGVAVICVASIVIPLATLGIREYRRPTPAGQFHEGWLGKVVVRLGRVPAAAAVPLAIASIAIFAGGLAVEERLDIETDPVKWVNPDSEVIRNLRYSEREIGGSSEMALFVEADEVFTQEVVGYVDGLTARYLDQHGDDFVVASGIVGIVGDLLVVPDTQRVAPRADLVAEAYEVAPADIRSSVFSDGGPGGRDALNIVFLAGPGTLEERQVLLDELAVDQRGAGRPPEGATVTPSGLVVVGVGLLENLERNRILLTYLAIAFVGAFLAVRLRSLIRSLLSLVPVLIAVGATSLAAYVLDLQLSPMTAVGGPLVVAACTEFTSLILLRFVEERGRGLEPAEAADVAAARTGRAFIVSAMTTVAGVAVISLSSMPLLRDFGRVVGMNIVVALLSALVVLPPMLVWADRRGWVSRGMIPPDAPYVDSRGTGDGTPVAPA